MARTTLAAYITAQNEINANTAASIAHMTSLLETLVGNAAPAPVAPVTVPVARVTTSAPAKARTLTKTTRLAFIADNPWANHMSALAIAEAVSEGETVYGGWVVGAARAARIATGAWA